ncbi:MAG: SidJ-related pseudokinase [Deltaproteobacteria bacterium]|nr:SidJ-related pseudokinase [Deltaproteobacteria bacterium]
MNHHNIKRELTDAETVLNHDHYDFSAKYLAVCRIHTLARARPEKIGPKTIAGLESLFYNRAVSGQTQAYFLFKEAAGALCSVLACLPHDACARKAHDAVMNMLSRTTGHAQRAAAEALGSLPFTITGTEPKQEAQREPPVISWQAFLAETRVSCEGPPRFMGRSLVVKTAGHDRLLVVKLVGEKDKPESLFHEAVWLNHLRRNKDVFPVRFHIPKTVSVRGRFLFRLMDLPIPETGRKKRHEKGFAIAFLAHPDYFCYPNEADREKQLGSEEFLETILRNAFLFGKLTGLGIIHGAPVPLFHNRVQGARRDDQGLYLWQRGGRLDQWLGSCRYPNFGCSGIRDFEHLETYRGPARKTYLPMGAQLLSLFLVTGSYFRMKDSRKVGLDPGGRPVDARGLFHKPLLVKIIQGVFHHYYSGFVGKPFKDVAPLNFSSLADRMVDEMGVDRYMEEILRVADQQEMRDDAFVDFLVERRVPMAEAVQMKKGARDITLCTGPHLGGFNQQISIPELIESVGTMAALCLYGRYCEEKQNEE